MPQVPASSRFTAERRSARERAMEVLYEAEIKDLSIAQVLSSLPVAPDPFALQLVEGVDSHLGELDARISSSLKRGWSLKRLPTIDRLVLRLGAEELMHHRDTPAAVVLDECVRLAKGFSTDESGRFVNGVLAAIAKSERREPTPVFGQEKSDLTDELPIQQLAEGTLPVGLSLEDEPATILDT